MKNILVPCDFSKPAEEAFKFAVSLATKSQGNVHVLYVVDITFLRGNPTLENAYAFNVNFLKEIEQEADQKFQIMRSRYAPLTLPVKFTHRISSLTSEITNYCHANAIDLVVMGTHGEGNATLGSNAEKVVRTSTIPVLSLRTAPSHIENIVVPIVPDQLSNHFIKELKALQNFFQAKIHLLYVNTPLFFQTDPEATKQLKSFVDKNQFTNYSITIRSDYSVEAGIGHFTKEINADLIALGTHAWRGLAHFFVGSKAEDLVNHIKIPIWTLRLQ